MKFKKSIGFVLMVAAAGIAGTGGITSESTAAPAKPENAKLNSKSTATVGDGQDVGANAQMQAAAKGVEQVGDDVNDGNIPGSAGAGSSELNSSQADATTAGAKQAT